MVLRSIMPALRRAGRRAGQWAYGGYFWGISGLLAPGAWLAAVVPPRRERRRRSTSAVLRAFFRAVGVRLEVDGLDRLPAGPTVVVCNHASDVDGLVLAAVLPPRFTLVAKSELLRKAFTRSSLRRLGMEFVERSDPERGAADTERLVATVRQGRSIALFAEGTDYRAPGVHPFHMGAFVVAARTGTSVTPMAIAGTRTVLRPDQWLPRRAAVRVSVLPPLPVTGRQWEAALALRDQSRSRIAAALGEPLIS
jgi:1-acyl-sn-glycerol-3-phosphate acyltransferase